MNSLRKNSGYVYFLLPYIISSSVVRNRVGLILSILFGRSYHKIKLKDSSVLRFKSSQFTIMLNLIGILTFSTAYSVVSRDKIEISFDTKNKLTVSYDNLSYEDENLLNLLYEGLRYGANFITEENIEMDRRDKTLKIIQDKGKKIVETSEGIKFYLDSIVPETTIVETFVRRLHLINSHDNWDNKIIINVGAQCGDTPLYYASKGATVYAFEPTADHFNSMIRNISLNPKISNRIIPINAAIGQDGILTFYESDQPEIKASPSFVYNTHGKNVKTTQARGYSLESAFKEFNIGCVDLLQMDCKGCEFFLTENALKNVNKVKIETMALDESHKLEKLLKILENSGFQCVLYRMSPFDHQSINESTNIYGKKLQNQQ